MYIRRLFNLWTAQGSKPTTISALWCLTSAVYFRLFNFLLYFLLIFSNSWIMHSHIVFSVQTLAHIPVMFSVSHRQRVSVPGGCRPSAHSSIIDWFTAHDKGTVSRLHNSLFKVLAPCWLMRSVHIVSGHETLTTSKHCLLCLKY